MLVYHALDDDRAVPVAVAVSWLGLAFGPWAPLLAVAPLVAAIVLELDPREHP